MRKPNVHVKASSASAPTYCAESRRGGHKEFGKNEKQREEEKKGWKKKEKESEVEERKRIR